MIINNIILIGLENNRLLDTIVIVSDSGCINGGNAKVALNSAIELSKKGLKVILFCGMYPISDEVLRSNIEVICLNQKDILNEKNRIRAITQGIWNSTAKAEFEKLLIKLDRKSTIIHFHSWSKALSCSLFAITNKYKFKIIITAHDYFGFCPNGGFYNYKKNSICNYKPMSLRCISCNCDPRKFVHKIWRITRQIVQNAVLWRNKDITYITISDLNDRVVRANLDKQYKTVRVTNPVELCNSMQVNVQDNKCYIFIGRLSEEKGIDLFCEALKQLKLPGVVLGDGYKLNELKIKYPNIEFVGWVSRKEMENYLYGARAMIFPSMWYEGAPLVIIEMKSYGIPCIVSDVSSACEEIKDGEDGYIFRSGDLDELKSKIMLIENSNISAIGNEIINKFNANIYSMNMHMKKLLDIYNSIISGES